MNQLQELIRTSGYASEPERPTNYQKKEDTTNFSGYNRKFTLFFHFVIFFCAITLSIILLRIIPVSGEDTGGISIDPIGDHQASEPFDISGTTDISPCNQVGIEIFPKPYWDAVSKRALAHDAKGFRFLVISVTDTINSAGMVERPAVGGMSRGYAGVQLILFNQDGTRTFIAIPSCPDHRIRFAPVTAMPGERKHWKSRFNADTKNAKMRPNAYYALVWDATNQLIYQDVNIANVWDARGKKTYPTTSYGNIWDPRNKKDYFSRSFYLR